VNITEPSTKGDDHEPTRATVPGPRELTGWVPKSESKRWLNDVVESHHLKHLTGPDAEMCCRYPDAINNEQAKEGSMAANDFMAAQMRSGREGERVAGEGRKACRHPLSLGVVLRRHSQSRRKRAAPSSKSAKAPIPSRTGTPASNREGGSAASFKMKQSRPRRSPHRKSTIDDAKRDAIAREVIDHGKTCD
jgi:hypothetical protein